MAYVFMGIVWLAIVAVVLWQIVKGIMGVVASDEAERKGGIKRIALALLGGIGAGIAVQIVAGALFFSDIQSQTQKMQEQYQQ